MIKIHRYIKCLKLILIILLKKNFHLRNEREEADKIIKKYPGRVPVICERSGETNVPSLDKKKYLVPTDLSIGQFIHIIRKRLHLDESKALFMFINNIIPMTSTPMGAIYDRYQNRDGFLYIRYSGENTFG